MNKDHKWGFVQQRIMRGKAMTGLNMSKINNRLVRKVSLEEALSKVEPITWPDDVFSGERKVEHTKAEKEVLHENRRGN